MPTGGLIIGGLVAGGSAIAGANAASSKQDQAQAAMQQAVNQYLNINVPDPREQQLILQQYQNTGKMDPRLAQAFQQAQSKMSNITTNPALQSAQMQALSSLQNTANQGGHTLAQDAYLNQVQQQVAAQNAGRQGAIEQQFAERGMGGAGGLSLSALEQNNQNQTQNQNQASLTAAAQAQENALQSLQGAGNLAGNIQNQEFNRQAQVAQAQDSINRFNTQMNQGVENQNVANQNAAQSYNVQNAQNLANSNTGLSNQQQIYNKGLLQQEYQNQLQKAQGTAAGYEGQAGLYTQQGNTNANMYSNLGQGALKAGAAAGNIYANSKNNDGSIDLGNVNESNTNIGSGKSVSADDYE